MKMDAPGAASRWRVWVIAAATLVTVAITARLGFWQLDRAAQKQGIAAQIEQRQREPELHDWSALVDDSASLIHRRAVLTGTWATQHTVYLDNRQMDGRPGFFVVTPLLSLDGRSALAVQRGWIARDRSDRSKLSAVETPAGVVTVSLRLAPPPARLYEFESAESGPIRQNLDLETWRKQIRLPLATRLSALQIGEADSGLLRRWPQIDSGVAKHHGYAAQWFGLSALACLLWIWFQLIAPRRQAARRSGDESNT